MAEDAVFEASGFKNVRSELKAINIEMQTLILNGQQGTAQFTQLGKRAAEIKDAVDDARDAQASFTGAGQFQAVTKAVQGVVGGFTAVQGAIALAGGSSKEFEKTMIKLQAAMAMTQGLAALEDMPRAFNQIKTVGVSAFKAIKGAIGATGIGLLVIALGTIVAFWDDIVGAVSGVSAEQKTLNQETAKQLTMNEANLSAVEGSENIMKLQGKTEEEIYNIKLKQYDTTILSAKASLANAKITKDAQVDAAKRNFEILKGILQFLTAPLAILLETIDAVGRAFGKDFGLREGLYGSIAKMVFDPESVAEEGDKAIKEAENKLRELENKRAGLVIAFNDKKKAERDKAAADAKAANDKEDQKQLDAIKKRQQAEDELYIAQSANDEERERRTLERKNLRAEQEIQSEIDKYTKIKNRTKEEEQSLAALLATQKAIIAANDQAFQNLLTKQTEDGIKKRQEAEKKAADDFNKLKEEEYTQTLKYVDEYYAAVEKSIIESGNTQKQISRELEQLEIEKLKRQILEAESYGKSTIELELALAKKKKEITDNDKAERKADLKDQIDAVLNTASAVASAVQAVNDAKMAKELKAVGDNEQEREKIQKKYFEENKKVQIAQAIIAAIQGAIGAFTSLAAVPVVGPVLGGIAAAAALAAGFANVAKIRSTTFQSKAGSEKKSSSSTMYEEGGLLYGPSHNSGGIRTTMGELEGGEFVMNRRATANFLPLLESINTLGNTPGPGVNMQQGQQPIKTYVIATDVTSAQEANSKLAALARL